MRVVTLGPDPDRLRPALLVDANQHATELSGSVVALAIAERFLALHLDRDAPLGGLPEHERAALRDVLVYVVPRLSPDGAERVLRDGAWVRSVPRDPRPARGSARWVSHDVDGDGLALLMRREDPLGDLVASRVVPGLLVPRELGDPPPYYKVWPEGSIENFDGVTVPSPGAHDDQWPDLNRNFPYDWRPEPTQHGAGEFATSEPESRGLVAFVTAHPEIFAWIDLHTFGGVFIRPLGAAPDTKLDEHDLALFRELGAVAERLTGYPMVSGFEDFTYSPDTPIYGDMTEYAYHQRACLTWVVELWDPLGAAGVPKKGKRFVDRYAFLDRTDLEALAGWIRDHGGDGLVRPWVPVHHPQLGPVEVGCLDPRFCLWNPPASHLAPMVEGQVAVALHVAAAAPRVRIRAGAVREVGEGTRVVDVIVDNAGWLPTTVVAPGRTAPHVEPLRVTATAQGCRLVEPRCGRVEIGHLDGWGRGRWSGQGPWFLRSKGTTGERTVSFVVQGSGELTVTVASCRTGRVAITVPIGAG